MLRVPDSYGEARRLLWRMKDRSAEFEVCSFLSLSRSPPVPAITVTVNPAMN